MRNLLRSHFDASTNSTEIRELEIVRKFPTIIKLKNSWIVLIVLQAFCASSCSAHEMNLSLFKSILFPSLYDSEPTRAAAVVSFSPSESNRKTFIRYTINDDDDDGESGGGTQRNLHETWTILIYALLIFMKYPGECSHSRTYISNPARPRCIFPSTKGSLGEGLNPSGWKILYVYYFHIRLLIVIFPLYCGEKLASIQPTLSPPHLIFRSSLFSFLK